MTKSNLDRIHAVWPPKCHCIDVKVTATIEMPTPTPGATFASMGQISETSQTFSDSLLAASKASSVPGGGSDANPKVARQQGFSVDDAKSLGADPGRPAVQPPALPRESALPQQVLPAKQASSSGRPLADATASSLESTTLTIDQTGVVESDTAKSTVGLRSTGSVQAAAMLSGAKTPVIDIPIAPSPKTRNNASNAVVTGSSNSVRKPVQKVVLSSGTNEVQALPLKSLLYPLPIPEPIAPLIVNLNASLSVAPTISVAWDDSSTAVSSAFQNTLPNTVANGVNSLPNAGSSDLLNTLPKTVLSAPSGSGSNVPSAQGEVQTLPSKVVPNDPKNSVSSISSDAGWNFVETAAPSADVVESPASNVVPSDPLNAVASIHSYGAQSAVQAATHKSTPNDVRDYPLPPAALSVPLSAVPNALRNADSTPVSVPYAASNGSARSDIASTSSPVSRDQAAPPAVAVDLSVLESGLSSLGSTSDQFVALTSLSSGLMGTGRAGVSALTPADLVNPSTTTGVIAPVGIKDASSSGTALKQHAQPASDLVGSLNSSQGTPSSGDQNQRSSSSQGQNATQPQSNFSSHPVASYSGTQVTGTASTVQNPGSLTGAAGHAAKAQDNAAPASTPVAQPLPAINTAKLIQTMGQSEMRVGMRSNEFGNISISTSATRDLISAQISLDHGELARALAAHLPEMQARLGSDQAMDVRINMNGNGIGQGTGPSGGGTNGSADQSSEGRQQPGNAGSSYSRSAFAERQFSPVAATMTTGDGRLNARLDIRV